MISRCPCLLAVALLLMLCGCDEQEKTTAVRESPAKNADPEARWAAYAATLSLKKEDFSDHDPIVLTLRINDSKYGSAQWWLYSPENIRVQDERGNDIPLMIFPLNAGDGIVRSKVIYRVASKDIDLTSFVEPYFGIEHVCRFAPGKYAATFYFTHSYPHVRNSFNYYDRAYPKVWGAKTSNTVSFTVHEARGKSTVGPAELFGKALEAVQKNKADEAVAIFKQLVLNTNDQAQIEIAIREIMLIRECRVWDDHTPIEKNALFQKISALRQKSALERGDAFSLSLLHLPEQERKSWWQRYLRYRRYMESGKSFESAEEMAEINLLHKLSFDAFHFPQFRSFLLDEIKDPQRCEQTCLEMYLSLSLERDTRLMAVFLKRFPKVVLHHYESNAAPRGLVPSIVEYFSDTTPTWGSRDLQACIMDSAFLAFARATGIKLTYKTDAERIEHRDDIKEELRRWWDAHKKEYGPPD